MAKLSSSKRSALPSSDFAGPNRSFPVNDKKHARAAIMLSKYAPDPSAIKAKAERVLGTTNHKAGCGGNHMGACKT